jgi:hypothetical protein
VKLYLHSPEISSWRGAQLKIKHRDFSYLPTYLPACLPACLPPYANYSKKVLLFGAVYDVTVNIKNCLPT